MFFSLAFKRPVIKIVLKNDHGRERIDLFTPTTPIQSHVLKALFRFKTRKTLVPKYDWHVDDPLQLLCKFRNLLTLTTFSPIHMKRLAYYDPTNLIFERQSAERAQIRFEGLPAKRWAGLRRHQQRIADGDADILRSDVQRHHSHIFMIPAGPAAGYNEQILRLGGFI
jgi:hypothetical protein